MMSQFAFEDPAFEIRRHDTPTSYAERQRAHASEVMADLTGATAETLDSLPEELPVEAAVACGNCRLYGGVTPQVVFPAWLATAAARRLAGLLDRATADAEAMPALWDECTGEEAEDLVAGLLHARMDSWAAAIQLDDVLDHAADDEERPMLEAAIDEFDAALARFDVSLGARQDHLATLAGTRLLGNLRGLIAPAYGDPLPWWLDGRLEAHAEAVDEAIDRLVGETLFQPAAASSIVPASLIRGRLRAATSQTYAAAASATGMPKAEAVLRWRSPDRGMVAELVPPVARQVVPERLVIDFKTAARGPAIGLVGRTCRLAGAEAVIEQRAIDGIERAVASFSGAAVLGPAGAEEQPVDLVVAPDPVAWTFVASR